MRAHHVCKNCGSYRGRQVIEQSSSSENE
jgi:ribosomal protein L32